jgi:N-acylneuraminate cytidylyltransferase
LIEINNAVFIADSSIYKTYSDRIGKNPYLLETSKINSFDIDWQTDFDIAEQIYLNNVRN